MFVLLLVILILHLQSHSKNKLQYCCTIDSKCSNSQQYSNDICISDCLVTMYTDRCQISNIQLNVTVLNVYYFDIASVFLITFVDCNSIVYIECHFLLFLLLRHKNFTRNLFNFYIAFISSIFTINYST